jgi:hypothetical protein
MPVARQYVHHMSRKLPEIEKPILVSRRRAAAALGISMRKLDEYLALGLLKSRWMGRRRLIPYAELIRFAEEDHR